MSEKTKVVAEVESREVTIHEAEGVDQITLKGKRERYTSHTNAQGVW